MSRYLEVIYGRTEYDENDYPQQLCDYLLNKIGSRLDLSKKGKLLDIACGRGNHLIAFQRRGFEVTGVDRTPEAADSLPDLNIVTSDADKNELPFEDESFDVVFSKSLIEHIHNVEHFVSECRRVLKPDGVIIFLTPDWCSHYRFFFDDYQHVTPWTRKSLQNVLKIFDFESVESELFRQLPFFWKCPQLEWVCDIIKLLPDTWRFKDKDEMVSNKLIRFSKEKMIVASAKKPQRNKLK